MEVVVVVREEDELARQLPLVRLELHEHPPDPRDVSHLPPQLKAPGQTPVKVPAEDEAASSRQSTGHSSDSPETGLGVDSRQPPDVGEGHPLDGPHTGLHPAQQLLLHSLLLEEGEDGLRVVVSEVRQVPWA